MTGIGGYDLLDASDEVLAFDYDGSGKLDHLVLYRPGTGTISILKNTGGSFAAVYPTGPGTVGIGGYDLRSPADRVLAFDYDGSGKLDHLVLYRPGTGTISILKNTGGSFAAVYPTGPGTVGIGGYDLRSPADRVLAFDYDGSGKLDHLVLYRPGTGTISILKNTGGSFAAVYPTGPGTVGIGGYDLRSPADRVLAFDYDGSGKLDHLVLCRPGSGSIYILKNTGGSFAAVYPTGPGTVGIGGYDLRSPADRVFAFDYDGSGKLDHLVLYRPGTGTISILKNTGGSFAAVYPIGGGVVGIDGYDLMSAADRVFAYDYDCSGKLDHLVLYRPGTGTIFILTNRLGNFAPVYAVVGPTPPPYPVITDDHGPTGCGIYCRVMFPLNYDQVVLAFQTMKKLGVSEGQATDLARDGGKLAEWLYSNAFGELAGIAAGFVATKCALCAKDSAY